MEKKEYKMHLSTIDDIFTTQEERNDANLEKVKDIPLSEIDDFPNHPFKVLENNDMQKMCDSIRENGVLVPTLVRLKENGRYEMISGHRRKKASELCGLKTIPCIIRELTLEEATIIMVDSNMQREQILPSEKAFAYKMKLEALSHQGKRNDLTSTPMVSKLRSNEMFGKEVGESREQIRRYIRLTELIPKLLDLVDDKAQGLDFGIALRPAVEISYLKKEEQEHLLKSIQYNICTPSLEQAITLKELSKNGNLSKSEIDNILQKSKPNQTPMLKVSMNRLSSLLPQKLRNDKEREEYIITAVEWYDKYLKKQREKEQNGR